MLDTWAFFLYNINVVVKQFTLQKKEADTMPKDMNISLLFDFYGEILTEKQQDVIDYYYNDDLSLAEISEHLGITRQGVRDSIKRAEATLLDMEDKLGLAKRFREIQRGLDTIISEAHAIEDDSIRGATIRDITQHTMKIVEVAGHLND